MGITCWSKERVFLFNVFPSWRILFLLQEQSVHSNVYLWTASKSKVRTTSSVCGSCMIYTSDYIFVSYNTLKWAKSEILLSLSFLVFVAWSQIIHIALMQFCLA